MAAAERGSLTNRWFNENVSTEIADALIRISVKLADNKVVSRDFRPDLEVNYDQLEEQLSTIPSIYAYWAMVMSEQKMVVGILERKIKRRRAVVAQDIFRSSKQEGISLRGTDVKELIESDEKLEGLEAELLIAQKTSGKLWNIVEALRMKSEGLRSLAGFKKQEMRDA
jgi:hypothetical protein